MASRSLRRSRLSESDDEDETSRPSTPLSTAPHDGKRARRSSVNEDEDEDDDADDDVDGDQTTPEQAKIVRISYSGSDRKPSLANGKIPAKPKHQPGAIVRVKLTNFVTYTSAEFFPGPNLNMVIGPNGTGKSTLVCAICLGLGWGTQYLGRAKDAAEFVKHGCREATIEIELQRSTRGRNSSRSNPVISRTIKREGNKSAYTLNGQQASGKAVMELAKSFDIQIDNLCQFLPQDKVVEFAQMTPIEILQSTQRAAAPPQMLERHNRLKDLRRSQKENNDFKKNDREALANLENRQEMQRTEVERLRERAEVQKKLGWLTKCRPIPEYLEAKADVKKAKERQKMIAAELKTLKEEMGPVLRKVEAKRVYTKKWQEYKETQEKVVKQAERECDRIATSIDEYEEAMQDCDRIESSEKKDVQPRREQMIRARTRIATLKRQKEQEPEPFDSRAMNQEIQDRVIRIRQIEARREEIRSKTAEIHNGVAARTEKKSQVEARLKSLQTVSGRQEELLKVKSSDAFRAWNWIKKNQDKFQKAVFGPPMVECTVKNPSMAKSVESLLQQNDFRVFTVQCREDFRLLQRELNHNQRLHDISLRTCPATSLDSYKSPLSPEDMQKYGLKGWAIDNLEGPATVLAMLCSEKFLHQTAITDMDPSQAQHDQLAALPGVKGYVTKFKAYQFVRRLEFGAAGVHAKERTLREAEIWTSQPVGTQRRQQLETELLELRGEIDELRAQTAPLEQEDGRLRAEFEQVNAEVTQLRADKDEKQRALAEYNGLDTKIAQEDEKIATCQHALESLQARLKENRNKRDEAMFAKADSVLAFCEAVHKLQEKNKALVEMEVAYIEARNDFDVLKEQNDSFVKTLEQKQAEEQGAGNLAKMREKTARGLMEQVKALRDEGNMMEASHNEPGLRIMLQELSQNADFKVSELEDMIKVEEAKLELAEGGDINMIREFEERAKKIEQVRLRLSENDEKQQALLDDIREERSQWEAPLDALVAKISDAFGDSFSRIGCAGQVVVYKASSDDPVDCVEALGGSDNGLDFANWAIHISVKFRENEPLSLLDSHRQSGGERAVSTIFYLMALQSLSRAPFRVVDEINQGMDPRNERMVHGRMVDIAAADEGGDGQGSQYFLITPKLLSGLKYRTGMTILCIVSGENMPSAAATKAKDEHGKWRTVPGKRIDFGECARRARQLQLSRGARARVDSGMGMGTSSSFGTSDTVGRSQTPVGA